MPEAKSFAEAILKGRDSEAADGEVQDAYVKDRPTVQAFSLRMRFKDGRSAQGIPWALFSGYEWIDEGRSEHLSLVFTTRVVDVYGQHLWRLVDLLDEGQLKALHEQDSKAVELLRAENADRPGQQKRPVIVSIQVTPPFAEAVREIQGESDDSRLRAGGEGRGR